MARLSKKKIILKRLDINKERIRKSVVLSRRDKAIDKENINNPSFVAPKLIELRDIKDVNERRNARVDNNKINSINNRINMTPIPHFVDFPSYVKKEMVDFDVAICISSYNRYDKVRNILQQLFEQNTKYSFKIFLMNDGSTNGNYSKLKIDFPEIQYIENSVNGGKIGYWQTISKLWLNVEKYNTHALCQIDDDFILCNQFIETLMDKFFEMKSISNDYMAFHYHIYNFQKNGVISNRDIMAYWLDENNQSLDGGVLYDIFFINNIGYSVGKTYVSSNYDSSKVWINISNKLRSFGGKVYRFSESLAYHDGNEDSKLNPLVRKNNKMVTINFKK